MNQQSAASIGLAAIVNELGGEGHPRDLDQERDEAAIGMKPMENPVEVYAPKQAIPLPEYVKHNGDATRAGMLSAHAVVMEFEATAKEIEKLGEELKAAEERAAEAQTTLAKALADLTTTAKAYREEAKRVFEHVEDVTAKASEASALCAQLRDKILGGLPS